MSKAHCSVRPFSGVKLIASVPATVHLAVGASSGIRPNVLDGSDGRHTAFSPPSRLFDGCDGKRTPAADTGDRFDGCDERRTSQLPAVPSLLTLYMAWTPCTAPMSHAAWVTDRPPPNRTPLAQIRLPFDGCDERRTSQLRAVPSLLTLYMAWTPCTASMSHAAWVIDRPLHAWDQLDIAVPTHLGVQLRRAAFQGDRCDDSADRCYQDQGRQDPAQWALRVADQQAEL
jgi:hypothetical protein